MIDTQLDKSLGTTVNGHGTISIRVVVLEKGITPSRTTSSVDEAPVDAAPDELLPETDKRRATATFLEEPKRGRQCCVFLINGQRQHAWDNQFIVRELELKYLRNRMIVVVDCDGLKPEAIAQLMQGSRHQFFEGNVYFDVESRVLATLKGDPDLRRLEEEAEDDISSLEAGDEAVKAALDQLIEAHHEAASHIIEGGKQAGSINTGSGLGGGERSQEVIVEGESTVGVSASGPVLIIRPELATVRLKPNDWRRFLIYPKPEGAWKSLETMTMTFDPPVKELQATRTTQLIGEEVALKFVEPDGFEEDEYPIETTLRATAMFQGLAEPRLLERRVIVNRPKNQPRKRPTLEDEPTFLKVTSRQPIKIVVDGPDTHVKLRWNGKDELVTGNSAKWSFRVACESPSVDPSFFLTRPVEGRFELLIQASTGLAAGEQLKFDIEAIGPGKTLSTAFLADVVEAPSARKISSKASTGTQRRPPYDLRYVKKENWEEDETCWGQVWTGNDSGSFEEPTLKTPLTIFINQDMDLLNSYRDSLIARKITETTIQQRVNRYTAHVAFHLYQMYREKKQAESSGTLEPAADEQMRDEIQRVARTLLKLMEVSQ